MIELQCAGSWFSHHNTKLSVKDHSILEALSASLDDQEDTHVGPASSAYEAKHYEAHHFSAVYEGKARRIAKITDTRIHQHMEQGLVEWMDGSTTWIGIQEFSSAAQNHVRARLHGELEMDEEEDSEGGRSESKRRKRRRKEIPSQYEAKEARAKRKERRNKRHKTKETKQLDTKLSTSLSCRC